jgi:hypothetical protein
VCYLIPTGTVCVYNKNPELLCCIKNAPVKFHLFLSNKEIIV